MPGTVRRPRGRPPKYPEPPWLQAGCSRATWYRHRGETGETKQPNEQEEISTKSTVVSVSPPPAVPQFQHHQEEISHDEVNVMLPASPQAPSSEVPRDRQEEGLSQVLDLVPVHFVVWPASPPAPLSEVPPDLAPLTSLFQPVSPPSRDHWDVNDWVDHYHERAAILEFDGGYSRKDAEAIAVDEIIQAIQWSRDVHFWQAFHTAIRKREAA